MRLVFMGTPSFAVPTLNALAEAGHEIARVYSQPPRRAGRGKAPRPSAVADAAAGLGIGVETPERFGDVAVLADFAALKPEAAIVVAYGQILPQAALDVPRLGCINLHASLLPRWRGAAPIQRAVMAGDAETGAAVMQMEAGLDTGPVLAEMRVAIGPEETAGDLHDRLAETGAKLMVETLSRLRLGEVESRPQPEDGVTYAAKIDKAEARIDWSRPAEELARHVNGLSPFPGAWTMLGEHRIKLIRARAEEGRGQPGEVLDDRFLVACGTEAIRILEAQREGRGVQEAGDFLRGAAVHQGVRLGFCSA